MPITSFLNANYDNPLPAAQAFAAGQPAGTTQISEDAFGSYVTTGLTPPGVPQTVTGVQLRMAVDQSPLYSTIKTFLTAQSQAIQDAYAGTDVFNRTDALLASIVTAGVLTSAQVDSIFVAAAAITV